jgi:hypothetical protein
MSKLVASLTHPTFLLRNKKKPGLYFILGFFAKVNARNPVSGDRVSKSETRFMGAED